MQNSMDEYLLNKVFQPFVDRQASVKGVTSFEIATGFMDIAMVCFIGKVLLESWYDAQNNTISWIVAIFNLIILAMFTHFKKRINKDAASNADEGTLPSTRKEESFLRSFLFVLLVGTHTPEIISAIIEMNMPVKNLLGHLYSTFLVLALYVWACIPRPPGHVNQTEPNWRHVPDAI